MQHLAVASHTCERGATGVSKREELGMSITSTFEVKNLESPDERSAMEHGVLEVVNLP